MKINFYEILKFLRYIFIVKIYIYSVGWVGLGTGPGVISSKQREVSWIGTFTKWAHWKWPVTTRLGNTNAFILLFLSLSCSFHSSGVSQILNLSVFILLLIYIYICIILMHIQVYVSVYKLAVYKAPRFWVPLQAALRCYGYGRRGWLVSSIVCYSTTPSSSSSSLRSSSSLMIRYFSCRSVMVLVVLGLSLLLLPLLLPPLPPPPLLLLIVPVLIMLVLLLLAVSPSQDPNLALSSVWYIDDVPTCT